MKVCILNASYEKSDSPFKDWDYEMDPAPYIPEHECELHEIHKATAVAQLRDLATKGFDVFINLCDGAWDEDRAGIEVVQTLEKLGVAYTGADEGFYDPTRETMKKVCHAWGIPTPGFVIANRVEEYQFALGNLNFPMIVKHPASYGSIGLTKDSVVRDEKALKAQVEKMITQFGGALIEEFIEGREFSVMVCENADDPENPYIYAPVEYRFPPGESFKHFDMKWVEFEDMDVAFCTNPELDAKMREMSRRLFVGLKGRGYGRTDIRVNANDEPFILEINPNCSIFYPEPEFGTADNILKFDEEGHVGFLNRIMKAAIVHRDRKVKKYKPMFSRQSGYGLYATRAIAAGEVIIAYEQQPQNLVTRTWAQQHFSPQQKDWFKNYATPLTDEVWATWSEKPEEWNPINHSCEPNCWMTGLDITARRDIAEGEQLSLDYSTFCNAEMEPFECHCGSANCRKRIVGGEFDADYLKPYGDHLSDYVRSRRKQFSPA